MRHEKDFSVLPVFFIGTHQPFPIKHKLSIPPSIHLIVHRAPENKHGVYGCRSEITEW
jgi:hypothetical protein